MHRRYFVVGYRAVFGVLALAAVITQFVRAVITNGSDPVHFFSFFTIESNILAIVVFLCTAAALACGSRRGYTVLRGATTLYMVTTGIIYTLLLSGNEVALQTTIPWVNTVVHYLMPLVVLADWLVDPPQRRIPFKRALVWLVFPLLYFAYSLLRGPNAGWYPYPFLDPRVQGYGRVISNGVVIAAAVVGLVAVLSVVRRRRDTRT